MVKKTMLSALVEVADGQNDIQSQAVREQKLEWPNKL